MMRLRPLHQTLAQGGYLGVDLSKGDSRKEDEEEGQG